MPATIHKLPIPLAPRLSISALRVRIFQTEGINPLLNEGFNQLFNIYATESATFMLWKFNFLFMDEKSEFAKRLHDAMVAAGYEPRPIVLEREFNSRFWGRSVTFQAVRRWLKGEAIPSQEKLMVIAEWLNIEPQALRFGDKVARSVQARRQRWEKGVGYLERETFEAFLTLSAAQRKALREIIMALAGKTSANRP